ncbi:SDR family oxidoreductase [Mesobacillus subterraneus]|uniref:SDR family oxidoreductase n=1 Tax=Mesobacillus subterraneus TaxID=285983 RepID=A0A427TR48_9BACI|nr:SDR family oxidoreductase [Mesobacillus subterraneus]RSD26887.1 SDR family oxidoreductase [Mesobacillus subterraneus]
MSILVTGFNGKIGHEVARKLRDKQIPIKCAVRNVNIAREKHGSEYDFVELDFSKPDTFEDALEGIDGIFLMYPPGDSIEFEKFIALFQIKGGRHIVYLSVKDVQFMPFIHHYKNEKLIKKYKISYTFLRAGYFMQNLNDFLKDELKERKRIFVPAGKGRTSFTDARDIAEVAAIALRRPEEHKNKKYTITGDVALDFYEVAEMMTEILNMKVEYTNPAIREFKDHMTSTGSDQSFINVVAGIHIPTKFGLAKGIKDDFEKLTGRKPSSMRQYIEDYKESWM